VVVEGDGRVTREVWGLGGREPRYGNHERVAVLYAWRHGQYPPPFFFSSLQKLANYNILRYTFNRPNLGNKRFWLRVAALSGWRLASCLARGRRIAMLRYDENARLQVSRPVSWVEGRSEASDLSCRGA